MKNEKTIYTPSDYQMAIDYEWRTRGNWTVEEWRTRCHELVDIYVNQEDREFVHTLIDEGFYD